MALELDSDPIIAAAKLCPNCEEAQGDCLSFQSQSCWRTRTFKAEKKLREAELDITDRAVEATVEKLTLVLDGGWPSGRTFANEKLTDLASRIRISLAAPKAVESIPMLLWCPMCKERHLDVGEFATKVHHTHSCQGCGLTWRPAVVPTVGVEFLPGFKNP